MRMLSIARAILQLRHAGGVCMRMLSTARAIAAILQSTLTMEIGLRVCAADRIGPRMHVPSCVYWLFIASPFQASACEGGRILYGANTRVRRCMACASSQREGGRIGQGGRARQIHYLNLLQLQLWIRDLYLVCFWPIAPPTHTHTHGFSLPQKHRYSDSK